MPSFMLSTRIPNPDPVIESFVDTTYAWLDELKEDYQRCMGAPYEGGSGVLLANDVLILLHGRDASWARWDVRAFEEVVSTKMPGFAPLLPQLLAEITCFLSLHTRRGRVPVEVFAATQARAFEVLGIAAEPAPPRLPKTRSRRRIRRRRRRR